MRNRVLTKRAAVLAAAVAFVGLSGAVTHATTYTTYTYTGPYTYAYEYNPLSNPASWGGTAPLSTSGTLLNFNNIDGQNFTVANDGGNSFNLSGVSVTTWSSSSLTLSSNSPESTNPGSFQLVGPSPSINISGPGSVVFGGFASQPGVTLSDIGDVANSTLIANTGTGLIVSAMTTINQTGNSTLSIGATQNSSTGLGGVGISGTGGFIINGVNDSVVALASPNGTAYDNNFSGGVTLNSGILQIGTSGNTTVSQGPALGTGTLTVNGGLLRSLVTSSSATSPIANLANPIVIDGTNLNISAGSFNLSGNISGTLPTDGLHLLNAYSGSPGPIYVSLNGTDSYAGPTTIDNATPAKYQGTFGNQVYSTLALGPSGSLTNTSSINLGSNSTLALTAGSSGLGIPSAAPLNLTNASVSITPTSSGQTYNVTAGTFSGGNIFNLVSNGQVNTFNFSSPTFQTGDKPTLFFSGNWQATNSSSGTAGQAFFGGTGLATALDTNYKGLYPVVPFASGTTVAAGGVGSTSANAFVSYNPTTGITLVPFADSANVTQFVPANGNAGPGVANQFTAAYFTSGTDDRLLNLNNWNTGTGTFYTTYNLSGTANVYALAASYTATIKGGTLNVTGGVIATSGISGNLTFNSSTVAFGNNTGYLFSNGSMTVSTGSSITGNSGLVVNGGAAGGGGGTVTFSSGNTSNPFRGGLYIENGDLTYTNDLSLGVAYNSALSAVDGTITLNGAYLTAGSALTSMTLSRPVYLGSGGGGIWNANAVSASTFQVNSNISGPGAFYLVDGVSTSVTTLAGTNTYTGGTYIVTGSLSIASDANVGGSNAGPLVFANSAQVPGLIITGSTTLNTPIVFWGGGSINAASGTTVTVASPLTSDYATTASFSKTGTGTLNLTANSPNFANTTTVSAGTLTLSGNGALPQLPTLTVSSGAVFQIDNSVTNNTDRIPDQAKITLSGGTFNYSGNSSVASSEAFGSLAMSSTSTINVTPASATLTSGNVLSGTGTLIKSGPGTLILGNTTQGVLNTSFTGGTNVSGGTLKLTSTSSLGYGDTLKTTSPGSSLVAGGSMDLNGQTITEPITLTGGSLTNSSATPATLTSGVKGQVLSSVPTLGIGTGFAPGDSITLNGTNGSHATESLLLGLTQNSVIFSGGTNNFYSSYSVSFLGGGATTPATGTYSGSTQTFTLTGAGVGYTSLPTAVFTETYSANAISMGLTDTPPTITYNASAFTVVGVQPTNPGSGYTSASAVTLGSVNSANGTGLTAANFSTAVISSLAITGVNNIGGAGDITINPGITGTTGSLIKIGTDTVTLNGAGNYSGGTIINAGTLADYNPAGAGTGTIQLSGGTLALSAGEVISNNVNAPSGVSTISIAVGTLSNTSIGAFNISAGAKVTLAATGNGTPRGVLSASSLAVGGLLDVQNNGLDLPGSVTLNTVNNLVKQGYNAGGNIWQGSTGITSSSAAADPLHLTALGVITNDSGGTGGALYGSGGSIAPTFDGMTPSAHDVLVKLTYYGDANLDGSVTSSDYTLIDNGYLKNLTGWYNGDFNYDGVVNGSDYTLIDNAFNSQGVSLASEIAGPSAQIAEATASAVPEPASLALTLIPALALLGRRSRRR